MSGGFLIAIGVVVGIVVAMPLLAMRCKSVRDDAEGAARKAEIDKDRPMQGSISNPPPPSPGGFVIKRSDGTVAKQFWSANECWEEWDGAYALMWNAQTQKGSKPETMRGCWSGPHPAPRTK